MKQYLVTWSAIFPLALMVYLVMPTYTKLIKGLAVQVSRCVGVSIPLRHHKPEHADMTDYTRFCWSTAAVIAECLLVLACVVAFAPVLGRRDPLWDFVAPVSMALCAGIAWWGVRYGRHWRFVHLGIGTVAGVFWGICVAVYVVDFLGGMNERSGGLGRLGS